MCRRADKRERFVMPPVHMVVENETAVRGNDMKYDVLRRLVRRHAGEKVMVMGDMNAR